MARGWRLSRVSWALIRRDPAMIAIALLGTLCALAGAAAILYFGGCLGSPTHSSGRLALAALIGLYPLTYLSVFFSVALAAAASASFDGAPMGMREALGVAWERRGRIAAWLLGAAWTVATIFAVPLLALEDASPIEAIRGSGHLIRSKWGEGATGLVGIGAWAALLAIPAGIGFGIGIGLSGRGAAGGTALIAAGLGTLTAVSAASLAARQVFGVALFRHATGAPTAGFPTADLEHPFHRRAEPSRRRASRPRRPRLLACAVLGAIAMLVGTAAAFGPKHVPQPAEYRQPLADAHGYAHIYFDRSPVVERDIRPGTPVLYGGRRVGRVVTRGEAGRRVYVRFQVAPAYRDLPGGLTMELDPAQPRQSLLRLLPGG